jgi:hypothetical protein
MFSCFNSQRIVDLVRDCQSQIADLHLRDASLTSIQQQHAEAIFRQQLARQGITYDYAEGKVTLSFASLYVQDSGVIADVNSVGDHPLLLSVGEDVSVVYEPRDLTQVPDWRARDLSNAKFADLRKGSLLNFAGRVVFCEHWFTRPRPFLLRVDSEFRTRMSPADWVRKWWDGRLPGIEYVN